MFFPLGQFFPNAKVLFIFPFSKWENAGLFTPGLDIHQKQRSHCVVHWHPWEGRHQFLGQRQLNWLWYHWLLASRHAKDVIPYLQRNVMQFWLNCPQQFEKDTKRQYHSSHRYGVNMLQHTTDHDTIYANRVGQIILYSRLGTLARWLGTPWTYDAAAILFPSFMLLWW